MPRPTLYRARIDGGPNNPLPVDVSGYWEGDTFTPEAVEIVVSGRRYDLIDSLSQSTIDHLAEQVADADIWDAA